MMNVARSIWSSVQGDPVFMRRVNGWLTIFWIAMIPVSIVTGWINSVTYVAALSIWALVSGHWSTWQAARVEVAQQREAAEREENPLEDRVVEKIVADTELQPAPKDAVTPTSGPDAAAGARRMCEREAALGHHWGAMVAEGRFVDCRLRRPAARFDTHCEQD